MSFVGDFVSDVFGGGEAAEASVQGAELAAAGQREALEYLKEREEVPQQFRESATRRLGGIAGLPGGEGTQAEAIELARESPFYQAVMGERAKAAEEALLRTAGATGGFRSGNIMDAVAKLQAENAERALSGAYDRQILGLTELSQLPSQARAIADQTSEIGRTLAQGQIAGAQARQEALGTGIQTGLGIGSLLLAV